MFEQEPTMTRDEADRACAELRALGLEATVQASVTRAADNPRRYAVVVHAADGYDMWLYSAEEADQQIAQLGF